MFLGGIGTVKYKLLKIFWTKVIMKKYQSFFALFNVISIFIYPKAFGKYIYILLDIFS